MMIDYATLAVERNSITLASTRQLTGIAREMRLPWKCLSHARRSTVYAPTYIAIYAPTYIVAVCVWRRTRKVSFPFINSSTNDSDFRQCSVWSSVVCLKNFRICFDFLPLRQALLGIARVCQLSTSRPTSKRWHRS